MHKANSALAELHEGLVPTHDLPTAPLPPSCPALCYWGHQWSAMPQTSICWSALILCLSFLLQKGTDIFIL